MTMREALIQAHRETGTGDEAIQHSLRFADSSAPEVVVQVINIELKPECEREAIDNFKKTWQAVLSNPALQKQLIARMKKRQQNQ